VVISPFTLEAGVMQDRVATPLTIHCAHAALPEAATESRTLQAKIVAQDILATEKG
jgi:hypothetical protein